MEHSLAPCTIQYNNIARADRISYLVQGWSGVWISAEPRDDPQNFQAWRPPTLLFNGNCVLFPEIKRPKREADQSRSSDEVEEWINTYRHSPYVYMPSQGRRDKFTLTVRYEFWGFNRVLVLYVGMGFKNLLSSLYEAQIVTHMWARDSSGFIKQHINQWSTAYTALGYQLFWSLIQPFHILLVLSSSWCSGVLYWRIYCGIISSAIPSKLFINCLCSFHFFMWSLWLVTQLTTGGAQTPVRTTFVHKPRVYLAMELIRDVITLSDTHSVIIKC